ncbi:MAG: hypothetical protein CR994_03460 [Maribacter sp.]|nr:MAG: hypothetical protein CR994_03460 [Maribacter sp.]
MKPFLAIALRLKRKDKTDIARLEYIIQKLLGPKDLSINKTIGRVLREYSRTNPMWVKNLVSNNRLANISRREALHPINQPRSDRFLGFPKTRV